MKVVVDRKRCVGHARCASVSVELFILDEHGYIATDGFVVSAVDEKLARRGVRACPERIMTLDDSEG